MKENDIYTCMEWVGVKGERPSIIHDHGRLIFKQLKRKKKIGHASYPWSSVKWLITFLIYNSRLANLNLSFFWLGRWFSPWIIGLGFLAMERDNSIRLDLDSDAQLLGGTAEMLLLACVIASCNWVVSGR